MSIIKFDETRNTLEFVFRGGQPSTYTQEPPQHKKLTREDLPRLKELYDTIIKTKKVERRKSYTYIQFLGAFYRLEDVKKAIAKQLGQSNFEFQKLPNIEIPIPERLEQVKVPQYYTNLEKEEGESGKEGKVKTKRARPQRKTPYEYYRSKPAEKASLLRNLRIILEDANFFIELASCEVFDQIDHIMMRYGADVGTICTSIIRLVFEKLHEDIMSYVFDPSTEFTTASPFTFAYNKVLLEYIYPEVLEMRKEDWRDRQLQTTISELLSVLRSLVWNIDFIISRHLTKKTKGAWASVPLGELGIPYETSPKLKIIDLFAGVGSFRRAFESANVKCVWTNDILAPSLVTYAENFNAQDEIFHDFIENAMDNNYAMIPDCDGLLAGFPCKSYSLAGKREFLESGDYGHLIMTTLDIVAAKNVKFFVLENVTNFIRAKNDDGTKVWEDIVLPEITAPNGKLRGRYNVYHRVIVSNGYIPQDRERVFIIGIRKDIERDTTFDFDLMPTANPEDMKSFQEVCMHLNSEKAEIPYTIQYAKNKTLVNPRYNITLAMETTFYEKLSTRAQGSQDRGRAGDRGGHLIREDGRDFSSTITGRSGESGVHMIRYKSPLTNQMAIRSFTPRELTRVMSFDRDRQTRMLIPTSDANHGTSCGYSIVTSLLEEIAIYLVAYLNQNLNLDERLDLDDEGF